MIRVIAKFFGPLLRFAALTGLAAGAESTGTSPGGQPFWHYAIAGNQTGKAGMFLLDNGNGRELFVSATVGSRSWADNSFWYVLSHDAASGEYLQRHVQPPYRNEEATDTPAMVDFFPAQAGDAWQVVVALSDGTVIAYDATTRRESGRFKAGASITAATAADLDGDGNAELLVVGEGGLACRDLAGTVRWAVAAATGSEVVCGQLDDDAALEVVTSSGHVVDGVTKAVQWKFAKDGGWRHLTIGDVDGDGRGEWVAADAEHGVHAMDVDVKKTKWILPPGDGIYRVSCLKVARLDGGDQPMLMVGGKGSYLRVYRMTDPFAPTLVSQEFRQFLDRFLVGDPDSDGDLELVMGMDSGGLFDGHLRVVRQVGLHPEWQSGGIGGRFLSPVIGDVTGDGVPEIVTAATESTYSMPGEGGVVVLDAVSQRPIAMTEPFFPAAKLASFQLGLCDVDGDERKDVVMPSTGHPSDGVEVQTLRDDGTFELLKRFDPLDSSAEYFSTADVLDVDGDGALEMVVGSAMDSNRAEQVHVRVFDFTTGALEWTSPALPRVWDGVTSMALGDVDGDGRIEAVAVVADTQVSVFDLETRTHETTIAGNFRCVALPGGQPGFGVGTADGKVRWFVPSGGSYIADEVWNVAMGAVEGLTSGGGKEMWVVADRRVRLWRDGSGPDWASEEVLSGSLAPRVGLVEAEDGHEIYTGLRFGIGATYAGGGAGVPVIEMSARGLPGESQEDEGTFTISRRGDTTGALTASIEPDGSAMLNEDYTLTGAGSAGDGTLSVTFPAGVATVEVRVTALADSLEEGTERVTLRLVPARAYFCGPAGEASLDLFDDQPVISLLGIALQGAETAGPQDGGGLRFEVKRGGDLSAKLRVNYQVGGTATPGKDYRKLAGTVDFAAGQESVILDIQPIHDRTTEPSETLSLRLLPSPAYGIGNGDELIGTIADGEPTLTLTGVVAEPGGYRVLLEKSGGAAGVTLARLKVIPPGKYNAHPAPNRTVKVGANGGSFFIPSKAAETRVDIYLFSDDAYYLGSNPSLSFTLPAKAARANR